MVHGGFEFLQHQGIFRSVDWSSLTLSALSQHQCYPIPTSPGINIQQDDVAGHGLGHKELRTRVELIDQLPSLLLPCSGLVIGIGGFGALHLSMLTSIVPAAVLYTSST